MIGLLASSTLLAAESAAPRYLAGMLVGALIGALIGNWKGRFWLGIILGAFLGCIGWFIVAVLPSRK